MSKKWRVHCTEPGDEGWKYIWADSVPTGCPDDSGHSFNSDSIALVGRERALLRIAPHTRTVRGVNFTEIAVFSFDPDDHEGTLRRVKVLSYLDDGATSYDVELFDRNNNTQLIESNFTNMSGEHLEQYTGVLSTPPTSKTVLEVNVKKTGGNNNKYVRISEIILCFSAAS